MTTELGIIREFIEAVLEDREQDFWKVDIANQSYEAILNYVKSLGRDPKKFERVFSKNMGWFEGFAVAPKLRRPEHLKLKVFFQDRGLFKVRGKVNAQAVRVKVQPENPNSAALKGYIIKIFFDAPPAVTVNPKTYNKWLATNLETILDDAAIRSFYVHEFVHVLDYKRIDPKYLLKRANDKQQELDAIQAAGGKRDFVKYVNDPLELNAYFSQAMSDVKILLKGANSPEERTEIIGASPQEFSEKFLKIYLKKQVRKNISPENERRLMKRAATAWTFLT